jgi:DNA-binding FadR family transcriptional regulator
MKSERLSDQITVRIRQDIQNEKYKAGEKIPAEKELMETYSVGRSTIREAIKSLSMAGIVRVQQGNGTIVNEQSPSQTIDERLKNADFDEINTVRKLLEEEIVKLAVNHHTKEQLQEMEQQLALRKRAIVDEDRQQCINADVAFHVAIAKASSNKVLFNLYQHFTQTIRSFFSQRELQGIGHFAMSHHLHEDLYKAIRGKKRKQALDLIKFILDNNY